MRAFFKNNRTLLILSIISLAAFILIGLFTVFRINTGSLLTLDIKPFYASGKMVGAGVGDKLYDINTQYYWENKLSLAPQKLYFMSFLTPPYIALLFYPLSFLTIKNAYMVVFVLNVLILEVGLFLLFKDKFKKNALKRNIFYYFFPLIFLPVWFALLQAQLSFILFLGFVGSWYCFKHDKPFYAGLFLSLLLLKFHLAILPVLLLVWKKQRSALSGFFIVGVILFIISLLLVGASGLINYVHLLVAIPYENVFSAIHPQLETSLRGLLQYVTGTNNIAPIIIPLILGFLYVFILFLLSFRGKWEAKTNRFDIEWSILIIAVLLTSLHTYLHDIVLFIFPVIVFFEQFKDFNKIFIASLIIFGAFILSIVFFVITVPAMGIMYLIFVLLLEKNRLSAGPKSV